MELADVLGLPVSDGLRPQRPRRTVGRAPDRARRSGGLPLGAHQAPPDETHISSRKDVTHLPESLLSRDSSDALVSYFIPPALCLRNPQPVDGSELVCIQALHQKVR